MASSGIAGGPPGDRPHQPISRRGLSRGGLAAGISLASYDEIEAGSREERELTAAAAVTA